MEKWMTPCGKSEGRSNSDQTQLLQAIIEQSRRSLVKVEKFREKFAKDVFNLNWEQVQSIRDGVGSLPWLPKVDKELGKPLSDEQLNELELNTLLRDSYQYLQIIAAAVDQMIIDEEPGALAEDYKELESYVLSVLCEIQTAANTLNVARHKDVERTIVDEVDKKGDTTARTSRHYMIIRDYLKVLEYVIESYEHLKSKL